MWQNIDAFVKRYHMLDKADHIVIGLSGGADSVCLARYFLWLRSRGGPKITAVHINHMLRDEEADRDQDFVKRFCDQWELPLLVFKKDIRKISARGKTTLEEAGRAVRYACFREVIKKEKAAAGRQILIAVAHHADDLAETMIFRMIRGTGPKGLVGIRPVQEDIIRPLLGTRKTEIHELLRRLGQDFVEDSTNQDTEYSRNFIRHRILRDMEKLNPHVVEHLCSLARQEADLLAHIEPSVESICHTLIQRSEEGCSVNAQDFLALDDFARQEVARRLLFLAAGKEKDIGSVHVRQITELAGNMEGKKINLPYRIIALKKEGRILLLKDPSFGSTQKASADADDCLEPYVEISLPEYAENKTWTVPVDGQTVLFLKYEAYQGQQILKKDCEKYFDYDTIKRKIFLRTRREGDYFILDDQGRHKRLNRYFIDKKIPKEQRDRRLLLADGSHVLWILGDRISHACKIRPDTKRILSVTLGGWERF